MRGILFPLSGILLARGFMHACLSAFLPLYIMQKSGNMWLAGISLAAYEAAGVVGILVIGTLSDRFGRKKLLSLCLVTAPVSMLLFSLSNGPIQFLLLLVTGFSLLSTTPVMLAMIQEFSKEGSSAANGIFMMISFMARSAVVVLVGFTGDQLGLDTTYIICALLGLLGIPFVLTIKADNQ